ncbi:MAG TPA: hypothetical protein VLB12_15510 [Gemmatimonadales bacterium]|nr:hypothetical protein [Gemmatimonadales bacterium]
MNPAVIGGLFAGFLTIGILLMLEFGRRIRRRQQARHPDAMAQGLGAVEGAVFGLMGLLLAFTFSSAASRFDLRRQQIIDEVNNIGTAYLRLDLLAPETGTAIKEKVREYVDARIDTYRSIPDFAKVNAALARTAQLQQEIWTRSVAAVHEVPDGQATIVLLPALNEMFDIASSRIAITRMHPPAVIYAMLFMLTMICSFLAGYDMGAETTRSWVHMIGFALILGLAVYVIVDLEYPRMGLIRLDEFDQLMVSLRAQLR